MKSASSAASWKQAAWDAVERGREEWVSLLAEVIRRPSDNPPGDTTELATYIMQVLKREGLKPAIYEPQAGNPNIVASIEGAAPGRHLILNGHLDQFPVENPQAWSLSPYSGEVVDGRIYGRGAADMKGGTTALLAVTILLQRLKVPLSGKVTLTLVSDEETGGRWGAQWLVENRPELLGDALLDAEPSSPEAIGIAEKGICWLQVTTHSKGGHSGTSPMDNAIYKMCDAIQAGLKLRGKRGRLPASLQAGLARSKELLEATEFGKGNSWVLDSVTLNVGTIQGGCKANVVPALCTAEFDFRLPVGITPDELEAEFTELLREHGLGEADVDVEPLLVSPPNHTEPSEAIVQTLADNAEAVTGQRPHMHSSYGGSDGRFWRWKGIPAAIFGPRAQGVGAPNENILVEDYLTTMKVHAGTIIDYLGVADRYITS
jgi:succinyl-diaminopimelate desuccinylase